ncbi:hypothetical protein SAMN05428964_1011859 [Thalassospira xiamenensis]|uniref:Uncharacterized protein n=1 Tax=Thalassospira xiamenensis TaxID=220697 RepID=A0A285RQK7_9PROT|nr:hypothetical protein SAMN05428964_1011859 [Thalassospira xiamenensis]
MPLGQGHLFGAARAGAKLVRFSSVRSVKRDNAENPRARIAPGLDRHWIGWPGAGIGWRDRLPANRWIARRRRKADHRWWDVGLPCDNVLAFGVRCVFAVHRKPEILFGQRGLGRGRSGAAWFSSSPSRPVRFRLAHPVGGVWRCRGLRGGWIGLVVDQIVMPGAAERRSGNRARLKETGFPPSRE